MSWIYPNKTIYTFMRRHVFFLLLPLLMGCVTTQPRNPDNNYRILSLEPGDPVHLLLMDGTILHGLFIDRGKWELVVDCQLGERVERKTIRFEEIRKVSRTEQGLIYKPAGIWILIGMSGMLAFLALTILTGSINLN